jgi:hypothetical protein
MIHYHGYAYPPVGLIDIIESIKFNQDLVFYLHDPLSGIELLPYEQIRQATKSNLFVILQTGEGHSYKELHQLLAHLIDYCGVPAEHIVIYSGCLSAADSPVKQIGTIVPHLGVTLSKITADLGSILVTPTHHYVCLNRSPRWERYRVVEQLLDRGLESYGKISYGTSVTDLYATGDVDDRSATGKYRDRFPMVIDFDNVDIEQGYNVDSPAITGALFNIVTESAYELEPGTTAPSSQWQQQFPTVSEKTWKAFILKQIPIFVAPAGTVAALRTFGFDLFDDVIDHRYDLESDPVLRVNQVADQVERMCQWSMIELIATKNSLRKRFQHNVDQMYHWRGNHKADTPKFVEYFRQQGVTD